MFANNLGRPLSLRNLVLRHFKPVLAAANLPSVIRLHDLRHSCATLMLKKGINVKVVSERLGHSSAAMTLDVYGYVQEGMQEDATEKLSAVLFGIDPEPAQPIVH